MLTTARHRARRELHATLTPSIPERQCVFWLFRCDDEWRSLAQSLHVNYRHAPGHYNWVPTYPCCEIVVKYQLQDRMTGSQAIAQVSVARQARMQRNAHRTAYVARPQTIQPAYLGGKHSLLRERLWSIRNRERLQCKQMFAWLVLATWAALC
jgi:hypothetical protein